MDRAQAQKSDRDRADSAPTEGRGAKRESAEEALALHEAALDRAALQFKALGDPTRLRIIRLLGADGDARRSREGEDAAAVDGSGNAGLTVGDVSLGLFGKAKVSSTLSHHLKELRNAGLITMKRRGKNLICRLQAEEVATLRCHLQMALDVVTARAKPPSGKVKSNDLPAADHVETAVAKRTRKSKIKEGGTTDNDTDSNQRNDPASV